MISGWATFVEYVTEYGPWAGAIIILVGLIYYLVRVILDEDRSAAWRARIYKAVYTISGQTAAEKKYIENDISSRINLARRNMPFAKEYLPRAIRVQWFEGERGAHHRSKRVRLLCALIQQSHRKRISY